MTKESQSDEGEAMPRRITIRPPEHQLIILLPVVILHIHLVTLNLIQELGFIQSHALDSVLSDQRNDELLIVLRNLRNNKLSVVLRHQ